jgi:hypothetical protein
MWISIGVYSYACTSLSLLLLLPGFTDRVVYSLNELLQAKVAKTKTQQGRDKRFLRCYLVPLASMKQRMEMQWPWLVHQNLASCQAQFALTGAPWLHLRTKTLWDAPKNYQMAPRMLQNGPQGSQSFCPITHPVIGQKEWTRRGPKRRHQRVPWPWKWLRNQETCSQNDPKTVPKGSNLSVQ